MSFNNLPGNTPQQEAAATNCGILTPKLSASHDMLVNAWFADGGGTVTKAVEFRGNQFPIAGSATETVNPFFYRGATVDAKINRVNVATGTIVWQNNIVADYSSRYFAGAVWYDPQNNDLYSLHSISGTLNDLKYIYKTNLASGAITLSATLTATITSEPMYNVQNATIYPVDPANVGTTSDWVIVYPEATTLYQRYARVSVAGASVSSGYLNNSSAENVPFAGGYLSAARDFMCGVPIAPLSDTDGATTESYYTMIPVTRGGARAVITLFGDECKAVGAVGTGGAGLSNTAILSGALITAWGEDTVAIGQSLSTSTSTSVLPVVGPRILDRTDFDRWVNEQCDALGLPAGNVMFTP